VGSADIPSLEEPRRAFRAALAAEDAAGVLRSFVGRIGVVLSGGGARGAYEAGALLAFQDAAVPTHIIAATSIGSVNAASFAAHADGLVGNAEPLVASWLHVSPRALGIEWTRYGWMVAGLIATSAGLGNLIWYLLTIAGFELRLRYPALAWSALALAGASVLLFYSQLPYVWFLIRSKWRGKVLEPVPSRLAVSIAANALVGAFMVVSVTSLNLYTAFHTLLTRHPLAVAGVLAALAVLRALQHRAAGRISGAWERLFRFALQPGLFKNFERVRYLRDRVPMDRLRRSPIRVVVTATDLGAEVARHFANATPEQLAADPGVDQAFVRDHVAAPEDMLGAIVASSALPITYEPMQLDGRTLMDGAVMGSQPIRPALRLGADVLFLVLLEPSARERGDIGTFVDVGTRTLGILMHQHFRSDLGVLREVNAVCKGAAHQLRVPAEAIIIELGTRRMRYVKPFVIQPAQPLGLSIHDFGGPATPDAIAAGYRDAAEQIRAFVEYARTARFDHERRVMRLMPTDLPALQAAARPSIGRIDR
jgi:predicted acylesterase/phospholipase RssA